MDRKNIYGSIPRDLDDEFVEELLNKKGVRIERIVSRGQVSPDGFWYDQQENEWIVVLSGSAGILLEGEGEPKTLGPGDYLHIPARTKHRVEWTDKKFDTLWLAVFF